MKSYVPVWDLAIVLDALLGFPFEPVETASLQAWTWKTVFLIAITSMARVSEIQALDSREELLRIVMFYLHPWWSNELLVFKYFTIKNEKF